MADGVAERGEAHVAGMELNEKRPFWVGSELVSDWPVIASSSMPAIVGGLSDVDATLPSVAVTRRLSACPTSSGATRWLGSVAPGIAVHPVPSRAHLRHWNVSVPADHAPLEEARVRPTNG